MINQSVEYNYKDEKKRSVENGKQVVYNCI